MSDAFPSPSRASPGMSEITATISQAEARFERLRQQVGLFLAPAVLVTLWCLPIAGLDPRAHRLLAVLGAVVTLWLTEAIPMAVTALLGPALCVVLQVAPAKEVFRGFGDPILFLYLGGFFIAEAMLHHGLNRRIAFRILGLRGVGENPALLLLAFGAITGFISMWVSNTATTAMMFPIALAILTEMARMQSQREGRVVKFTELRYGTGLMLMAATPVGTPPNLVGLGFLRSRLGVEIPFFSWMAFGLPLAIVLIAFLVFYLNHFCPAAPGLMSGSARWIQSERSKLGPLKRGEVNTLIAFAITVTLWILPGLLAVVFGSESPAYRWMNARFPEAIVAVLGASLLFALPVNRSRWEFTLSWREARNIDWGTLLLFGGGLALGELMFSTGLAQWIGEGLSHALNARSTLGLVILFAGVATLVSETTSNLASATMVVPVAMAVAEAAGVNPIQPALAACLGASMGFMLPVSTPPNAIVYGSGCVPLWRMVKYGLLLDLVGFALIVPVTTWLVPIVLKL
jgi:solute carrier family 13 (sodium-dependent dicarboxylate transporter), member 2/3/5